MCEREAWKERSECMCYLAGSFMNNMEESLPPKDFINDIFENVRRRSATKLALVSEKHSSEISGERDCWSMFLHGKVSKKLFSQSLCSKSSHEVRG